MTKTITTTNRLHWQNRFGYGFLSPFLFVTSHGIEIPVNWLFFCGVLLSFAGKVFFIGRIVIGNAKIKLFASMETEMHTIFYFTLLCINCWFASFLPHVFYTTDWGKKRNFMYFSCLSPKKRERKTTKKIFFNFQSVCCRAFYVCVRCFSQFVYCELRI